MRAYIDANRDIFEAIPDGLAVLDPSGITQFANTTLLKMLGLPPSDVLEQNIENWTFDTDKTRMRDCFDTFMREGAMSSVYDFNARRRDGSAVPLSLNASLIRDDAGQPCGALAVYRDMQRLEKMMSEPYKMMDGLTGLPDQVLKQIPARVASLFSGKPWVMINLVEKNYLRYAYSANVPAEILGSGGEPLEQSICSIPASSGEALTLTDMTADDRSRGKPCVSQHGQRSYLGYPLKNSAGGIIGTLCVLRKQKGGFGLFDHQVIRIFVHRIAAELDRQEKYRECEALRDELEKTRAQAQAFMRNIPMMIWHGTDDGRTQAVSAMMAEELGFKEAELLTINFYERLDPSDLRELRAKLALSSKSSSFAAPLRILKEDETYGSYVANIRVIPKDSRQKTLEAVLIPV